MEQLLDPKKVDEKLKEKDVKKKNAIEIMKKSSKKMIKNLKLKLNFEVKLSSKAKLA